MLEKKDDCVKHFNLKFLNAKMFSNTSLTVVKVYFGKY